MASRVITIRLEEKGSKKVGQEIERLNKKIEKLIASQHKSKTASKAKTSAQKKAVVTTKKLTVSTKGLTNQFIKVNLASRAISRGIGLLTSAFSFGITSAINFEFTMAKISAISGVAGANLTSLERVIKNIASQSPKTSTQVAIAALEMSKMGLAGKDLENSLEGVVSLSVALDEEVNTVGQTLVNVKNVFQRDASEITNIADQMFTTLGNSALNLEKFGTAFSFAGASARLAGVSFSELSGLMGVLADNGIKASTIGTQLRQVFTRLDDPTSNVSQLLGEQSIKTRGLAQTLRILNGVIKNSGDAKKLFGQRAIGVIDILTKNIDKIGILTEKTRDMEKSTRAAADALGQETMLGALKRVASAFELLFINIGQQSGGFWTNIVGDAADGIKQLADLLDPSETENEFINRFVENKKGEAFKGRDSQATGAFGSREDWDRWTDDAKKAYSRANNDANNYFENRLQGLKDFHRSADNIRSAGKGKGKDSAIAPVEGGFDLILEMQNLASVQKQIADLETKTITAKLKSIEASKLQIIAEKSRLKVAKEMEVLEAARTKEIEKMETKRLSDEASLQKQIEKESKIAEDLFVKELEAAKLKNEELERTKNLKTEIAALVKEQLETTSVQTELANVALSTMDNMSNSLASAIVNGENLGETMGRVFKQMLIDVTAMLIKMVIFKGIMAALTGGSSLGAEAVPNALPFVGGAFAASGFDGTVSQPTMFIAGEEGSEQVSIKPRARMGRGDSSGGGITVNISGDVYGEEKFMEAVRTANENLERGTV